MILCLQTKVELKMNNSEFLNSIGLDPSSMCREIRNIVTLDIEYYEAIIEKLKRVVETNHDYITNLKILNETYQELLFNSSDYDSKYVEGFKKALDIMEGE